VKGTDGQRLWAYRYRVEGRGSARPQRGGFATRAEAQKALRKVLERLGPGGRATRTLGELVDEYLGVHQAEQVTIAKSRWLLGKATRVLGEVRFADLSPKDVFAWRLTIPEGHRFEATQALRQVLNRAVATLSLGGTGPRQGSRPAGRRGRPKGLPLSNLKGEDADAARVQPEPRSRLRDRGSSAQTAPTRYGTSTGFRGRSQKPPPCRCQCRHQVDHTHATQAVPGGSRS
jgi:hypothetical protein